MKMFSPFLLLPQPVIYFCGINALAYYYYKLDDYVCIPKIENVDKYFRIEGV